MTSYWHRGIRGFEGSENSLHSIGVTYNYAPSNSRSTPYVVYEDKAVLKEYIDAIKAQGANDLKTSKGLTSYGYKGSFNLNQTGGDFLFTLPYDKRMNIYVDGVKKETFKGLGIYTCCSLAALTWANIRSRFPIRTKGWWKESSYRP
jgi:hypothetical protein